VKEKLGEGGQGAVYLVEGGNGKQAIKWYSLSQSTVEQRKAITKILSQGPPKGPAGRRFVWPQDLVTAEGTSQFGYLMPLIDMKVYASLGAIHAHRVPAPGFETLCEMSYQIANSYKTLHGSGYCYRDISAGNAVLNTKTGDVLIFDYT